MEMRKLVGSIDQGTSSTRFLVFDCATAEVVTYHQVEIKQFFPHQGWCDEDPIEILASTKECMEACVKNLTNMKIDARSIQAIGMTNQRETTIVWDKITGEPLYNAIVWLDGRTAETSEMLIEETPTRNKNYWRKQTGLPITTYFSAIKLRWIIDNVNQVKEAIQEKRCMFGTVDTWLIWCLTGGVEGGIHATDVTNASRTMLMNLHTLNWDNDLIRFFGVEGVILPCIRSSSESFGKMVEGSLKGVSICGVLGDQQAALVGQTCFKKGQAKNTYGTGCFLLYNTGTELINSSSGLLTTVAYRLGQNAPVVYALEGSVAITGACIRWLRDNLEIIKDSAESESLAATVDDTDGCYFVPAFTGLFCPYWQPNARGTICGLSQRTNKAHITRAALEAVCFQTREILEVMNKESGIPLTSLQVDGGMTANNLLMQLQADLVGIPVIRPSMPETTALGAAMAAGLYAGCWKLDNESATVTTDLFKPLIDDQERDERFSKWMEAVKRSMHWETSTNKQEVDRWSYTVSGLFILTTLGLAFLSNKLRS